MRKSSTFARFAILVLVLMTCLPKSPAMAEPRQALEYVGTANVSLYYLDPYYQQWSFVTTLTYDTTVLIGRPIGNRSTGIEQNPFTLYVAIGDGGTYSSGTINISSAGIYTTRTNRQVMIQSWQITQDTRKGAFSAELTEDEFGTNFINLPDDYALTMPNSIAKGAVISGAFFNNSSQVGMIIEGYNKSLSYFFHVELNVQYNRGSN